MKKSILSLCLLIVLATVTNAAPRFGIIGEQEHGVGLFLTDDMYNAQLTYGTRTSDYTQDPTDNSQDESISKITVAANYKIALDSVTSLTAGVGYTMLSGYSFVNPVLRSSAEIDTGSVIKVNMGFERALSSNIVLTTQASVYTSTSIEYKTTGVPDATASSFFTDGRVGVAYLF
tara:strand:+ start:564 stop:1088 length:525 start_codon:yes stop_codon:yes gene_type:complete